MKKKTAAPATATPAIEPLVADASAPGKRHIDLTASPQAEPANERYDQHTQWMKNQRP